MVFNKRVYFVFLLFIIVMPFCGEGSINSNSIALNVVGINIFKINEDVLTILHSHGKSYSKMVRMNYKIVINFRIINSSNIPYFYIASSSYSPSVGAGGKLVVDVENPKNDWKKPEIVEIKAKEVYSGELEISKEDIDFSSIRISLIVLDKMIKDGTPVDFYRYIEANKIKVESAYYQLKKTSGNE